MLVEEAVAQLGTGSYQLCILAACGLAHAAEAVALFTELVWYSTAAPQVWTPGVVAPIPLSIALYIGVLIGAPTWGVLGDVLGRRRCLLACLSIYVLAGGLTAATSSYFLLALLRLVAGLGMGGCMPLAYTVLAEVCPASSRGKMLASMGLFWTAGLAYAAFVIVVRHAPNGWRLLAVAAIVPALIAVALVLALVPESARWLAVTGQLREAKAGLLMAARSNGARSFLDPAAGPASPGPTGPDADLPSPTESGEAGMSLPISRQHSAKPHDDSDVESGPVRAHSHPGNGHIHHTTAGAHAHSASIGGGHSHPVHRISSGGGGGGGGVATATLQKRAWKVACSTSGVLRMQYRSRVTWAWACIYGGWTLMAMFMLVFALDAHQRRQELAAGASASAAAAAGGGGGGLRTLSHRQLPGLVAPRPLDTDDGLAVPTSAVVVGITTWLAAITNIWLVDAMGRRRSVVAWTLAALAGAAPLLALPETRSSLLPAAAFYGLTAGGWSMLHTATTEVCPTTVRATGLALARSVGWLATAASALLGWGLLLLSTWLLFPFALAGLFVGCWAVLRLPETLGCPLEERVRSEDKDPEFRLHVNLAHSNGGGRSPDNGSSRGGADSEAGDLASPDGSRGGAR
ncbi:hypothetical protein HYH03_015334 [Edaphochlamys debaryana]|uniref:Major facilitator superfamily (MFS) profile domain-containing protein n=1 Tax=Edaphochlamys debaryana TaxID=47281 RepID=A0A835XPP8_9CHLO|nr:hypothetical protein HYH03_015334 [Edaphochlamys debaryana]|eukprot:KAG2486021.1 hypothetical protein HYH03_015334 [Edaphochlamys debaryana]